MSTQPISEFVPTPHVSKVHLKALSEVSLIFGFISIVGSIALWFNKKPEDVAGGERLAIFIGLWVPSLFILSNRLSRRADDIQG